VRIHQVHQYARQINVLIANRIGGTLNSTTSPEPVTLIIGDNGGSTYMNARFD